MSEITQIQKRKLQKIAQVVEQGNVAIVGHIFELEEKFDQSVQEVKDSIPDINKALQSIKGKDGESIKGETGLQGATGEQGEPGRDGKDGKDGKNGRDGRDGRDGLDGKDGADGLSIEGANGKDGSPDTPEQVVEKVNTASIKVKSSQVEGLDEIERIAKNNQGSAAVPVTTTFFKKNGTVIGRAKNVNFVEGNNISMNVYIVDDTATVSVTSTASGSGNFATEEVPSGTIDGANTAFTLAHTPTLGTVKLYLNGARQQSGGADYSISGSAITFTSAPLSGSILLADYQY